MKYRLPCLLLALACPSALAEIYSYINDEGRRVFTDTPTAVDAKPLELPPINRLTPAPSVLIPSRQLSPSTEKTEPRYQTLRIESPPADTAVREGSSGNLSVAVTSEPPLRTGHSYRLLLNDVPYGAPTHETRFQLTNLNRGSHQLAVEILDNNGQSLIRSPNQPVHILRTSFAQKRAIKPCEKGDEKNRAECRNL